MGVYDTLPKGSQVKCWDSTGRKAIGNAVSSAYGAIYIVLLQEGGFVRVIEGSIFEIVEDDQPRYPEDFPNLPCVDKWGDIVEKKEDLEGRCMFGYDYYFAHEGGLT